MSRLVLVPVGEVGAEVLESLARRLDAHLPFGLECGTSGIDPADVLDRSRGQYWSTPLLDRLASLVPSTADHRILGVADVDLFVPILTFVFGEAQLGGPAAVFSFTRLRPDFYGLPADGRLLAERSLKEALHEVGHTTGLVHCRDPHCVMRASTSAEEVDLKEAAFCRSCRSRMS